MKDRSQTHYSEEPMLSLPNFNGSRSLWRVTACGHMYDAGISVSNWDDVTCKSCLRKMGKYERVLSA